MLKKILWLSVLIFGFANSDATTEETSTMITGEEHKTTVEKKKPLTEETSGRKYKIDYAKSLRKLEEALLVNGMRAQAMDINSMMLRALIASRGVSENEAARIADNCLDGAVLFAAGSELNAGSVTVTIVNFSNGKSATEFDELGEKVSKSEIARFLAGLNTSYKLIKEENIEQEDLNFIRYRHAERRTNENVAIEISAVGIFGNVYVEMNFKNINGLTENDVLKFMRLMSMELIIKE